jgi:hypothetical protein
VSVFVINVKEKEDDYVTKEGHDAALGH